MAIEVSEKVALAEWIEMITPKVLANREDRAVGHAGYVRPDALTLALSHREREQICFYLLRST